jgi:hypothetical protein|tara:strand:+ start:45 stop:848 length:804 start_codon:yes stop_codon:yes gene_type:complete
MAQPTSRAELKDYCLRRLGRPILEINVDDDQIDDLIDDAIQMFNERHYNGTERMFLKHQFTADDKTRFTGSDETLSVGSTDWLARNNYIPIPDHITGINKVFGIKGSNIRSNLFGLEYQLFLNDLYQFGSVDILSYYMVKSYLETLDMVLNNGSFIPFRFNQRQDRLYIDTDSDFVEEGTFVIIDCWRVLDPTDYTQVYNDPFLKRYTTALIKRQWGQNLIKFQGAQLPGGITLNGRQIYDDAVAEIQAIEDEMASRYELPPMDMIG